MANGLLEHNIAACRTPEFRERRQQLHAARPIKPDEYVSHRWTPEEDALLGTVPDAEAAGRLGHTLGAIQSRRWKLHRPATEKLAASREGQEYAADR